MPEGMGVAIVRVDEKGRVVIPRVVREAAGLSRNSGLLAFAFGRFVVLSRVDTGLEPLDELAEALLSRRGKGTSGKACGQGRREAAPHEEGGVIA
jgi:bifunctional DNA-binding transcriptional regulator/antitoxin component of YhaV-PrlF toxin-antitoxin module